MSNEKNIRIVKGGERFIGSQDKDVRVTPLITTEQRENIVVGIDCMVRLIWCIIML